jgi:DNA-binding GntR family transcriptional regulator
VDVPEIIQRGPVPPHVQVANWIRARIKAGEYGPDDPLPSEKDLKDLFGIARDTAKRAYAVLEAEGLMYTIPRRGRYVVPKAERP